MGLFQRKKKEEIPAEEAAKKLDIDDTLDVRQYGRRGHTEGPIRFANVHGDRLPGGGRDPYAPGNGYGRNPNVRGGASEFNQHPSANPYGRGSAQGPSDPYAAGSQGHDPYGSASSQNRDPYAQPSSSRHDPYATRGGSMQQGSRGYGQDNSDGRNELLDSYDTRRGYQAENGTGASNGHYGGAQGGYPYAQSPYDGSAGHKDASVYGQADTQGMSEQDVEVEGIKSQIRGLKQESVASTRNTRRVALEAVETMGGTLDLLGQQTDRLVNSEQTLDRAKGYNERAGDETAHLKQLKRSVFLPKNPFVWDKKGKRDAAEARLLARHQDELLEREIARKVQYESRQRIDNAFSEADRIAEDGVYADRGGRTSERARYQFEATESDDELEDEIEDNLTDAQNVISRMKQLALAQNAEVKAQNKQISRIDAKAVDLDLKIFANTRKLANIK